MPDPGRLPRTPTHEQVAAAARGTPFAPVRLAVEGAAAGGATPPLDGLHPAGPGVDVLWGPEGM